MVAAREAFVASGHYTPIADAIAGAALETIGSGDPGCIADLGAGTGYYLARRLDRLPGWRGLALDASPPALRRAARAHERIGTVGCDIWRPLPVRSGAAGLALNVFAPRNPEETSRILTPGGTLVAVVPKPHHLEPLVSTLEMLSVGEKKRERLVDGLSPFFVSGRSRDVEFELVLTRAEARALVMMGPSAHHISDTRLWSYLDAVPEPLEVYVSVTVRAFRKRRAASAAPSEA